MSPLEIEILLHYRCRCIDHPDVFNPPPAQKSIFARFVLDGYLEDNSIGGQIGQREMTYSPTPKLHFYCDALCSVPEPEQVWIIPQKEQS